MNFTQAMITIHYRAGFLLRKTTPVLLALVGWCALLIVASHERAAYAQNTNATIRGQVLDPAGALVPNARVVIVNKDTVMTVYAGQTDSAGAFVAPQVIPGTYKVTVSSSGLKDAVIDNLVATVAQVASVNINMQIGEASQVVTVQSHGKITGTQPNRQMQVSGRLFF
jgi:hypothetical protein